MTAGIVAAVLTLLAGAIASDLYDWMPFLAKAIARAAARRLPPHLRRRLLREWLAEIDAIPGKLSKLLFAISLPLAAIRLLHEVSRRSSSLEMLSRRKRRWFQLALLVGGVLLVLASFA